MDRVIPPECSDCDMTEKCFHLTGGSVCEEVRREREVAQGVEIERLKEEVSINTRLASKWLSSLEESLAENERLTKLVATRYEHICSLQERLTVSKDDNKELRATIKELRAVVKEAKAHAELVDVCPNCGKKAVHLTAYDDHVCSACKRAWLAEDWDDELAEAEKE